jgi:hypothetical protein
MARCARFWRFAVDPEKKHVLTVSVHAAGDHDISQEIDAPKQDGGYNIAQHLHRFRSNSPPPNPPPPNHTGKITMFTVRARCGKAMRSQAIVRSQSTTKSRLETFASIIVVGPDDTKGVFIGQLAYNTDSMWQWQKQGSFNGSLDFQAKDHPFKGYSRSLRTHSAYWTPSVGHIITSTDSYLKPISGEGSH